MCERLHGRVHKDIDTSGLDGWHVLVQAIVATGTCAATHANFSHGNGQATKFELELRMVVHQSQVGAAFIGLCIIANFLTFRHLRRRISSTRHRS